jgi:hypothetical protein
MPFVHSRVFNEEWNDCIESSLLFAIFMTVNANSTFLLPKEIDPVRSAIGSLTT